MGGRGGDKEAKKDWGKREDKLSDDERKIPFIPSFNSLAVRNYPFLRQISLSLLFFSEISISLTPVRMPLSLPTLKNCKHGLPSHVWSTINERWSRKHVLTSTLPFLFVSLLQSSRFTSTTCLTIAFQAYEHLQPLLCLFYILCLPWVPKYIVFFIRKLPTRF